MKLVMTIISCITMAFLTSNQVYAQGTSPITNTFTIQVKGVGCNEDVKSIAASVEKLEGVYKCTPQKRGATTKFDVAFDPDVVSKNEIYVAVEDTPGCKNPKKRPYKVKNKEKSL